MHADERKYANDIAKASGKVVTFKRVAGCSHAVRAVFEKPDDNVC